MTGGTCAAPAGPSPRGEALRGVIHAWSAAGQQGLPALGSRATGCRYAREIITVLVVVRWAVSEHDIQIQCESRAIPNASIRLRAPSFVTADER
jgi:hypothetical protein